MAELLHSAGLEWPLTAAHGTIPIPELYVTADFVVLATNWRTNRHIKVTDFTDKTGFECFVNLDHISYLGTKESLVFCLKHTAVLRDALMAVASDRRFRVILSISEEDHDCTLRFHQVRPRESWLSDNIEGYLSEAILVFDVPS